MKLWNSRAQYREHSPNPEASLFLSISWDTAASFTGEGGVCTPGLNTRCPSLSCLTCQSQKNDFMKD